jgi:hypothetical protein
LRLLEVDGVDRAGMTGMTGMADGAEGVDGDAVVVDDSEESLPLSIVDAFEALASATAFFSALARARRVA